MRYGIVSDIHGNIEALNVVLKHMSQNSVNQVISCGDTVGYGPNPHECIQALRDVGAIAVCGNHDAATSRIISTAGWIGDAITVWNWNRQILESDDIEWLQNLPVMFPSKDFTVIHGSPHYPIREYIQEVDDVIHNKRFISNKICFFGHTHLPYAFRMHKVGGNWNEKNFTKIDTLWLNDEDTFFINPGSVGQPRDNNWRTSYMIYDSKKKTIQNFRLPYPVGTVQARMKRLNFPKMLYERLYFGH